MKISNTLSNVGRVPASLKFLALAASFLVPASAFAEETDSDYSIGNKEYSPPRVVPRPTSPKPLVSTQSLSLKGFYSCASESTFKEADKYFDDTKVDLGGLTIEYTKRFPSKSPSASINFVAALSFGGGSCDGDYKYTSSISSGGYTSYYSGKLHGKIKVLTVEEEFGVNLTGTLRSNNSISLFIGPRIGANFLHVEYELSGGTKTVRDDDWELGLLYGADAGVVFAFDESCALTFGVGYRGSTARPLDIERQSWLRFSVGFGALF